MPLRVTQAIRYRRTVIPSPAIYAAAAVLGALAGAGLQAVSGVPWWLASLLLVCAVWLVFASSALWGGRRKDLVPGVLDAISPRAGERRRERQLEQMLRRPPFPLYGLTAAWRGPRWIGGHGGSDGRITRLTLSHGDPDGEPGPRLAVEISADPFQLPDRTDMAEALWSEIERPPPGLTHEQFVRWTTERERSFQLRHAAWSTVLIAVEGEPVAFGFLAEGPAWVAHRQLGTVNVVLRGRNLAPAAVALEQIQDADPYIEGHRQMKERMRERYAPE